MSELPPGSAFVVDEESGAIIVPEGAQLVWASFPEVGWKRVLNRTAGAWGGDWLMWCEYDEEYDAAILIRAERRDHYEARHP